MKCFNELFEDVADRGDGGVQGMTVEVEVVEAEQKTVIGRRKFGGVVKQVLSETRVPELRSCFLYSIAEQPPADLFPHL